VLERRWSLAVWRLGLVAAGFVGLCAGALVVMSSLGFATEFLQRVLIDNLSYQERWFPAYLLRARNLPWIVLAAVGARRLARSGWERLARGGELLVMVWGITVFMIVVFLMPAPNPQAALQFMPAFALLAARARPFRRVRGPLAVALVTLVSVSPMLSADLLATVALRNGEQNRLMNFVLDATTRGEPVFDGSSACVFRRHVCYNFALVTGVRNALFSQPGAVQDLENGIERAGCRIVILDKRLERAPLELRSYLERWYVPWPGAPSGVRVAGATIRLAPGQTRTQFELRLGGVYRVSTPEPGESIDGRPVRPFMRLAAGTHSFEDSSATGGATLIAMSTEPRQ
jgi:hypothetical protein